MAIQTVVKITDTSGDRATEVALDLLQKAYTCSTSYAKTLDASAATVQLPLGLVTTAQYIYIETDTAIKVSRNNSMQTDQVDKLYFLVGCSVTSLAVVANSGATIKVFIAGG